MPEDIRVKICGLTESADIPAAIHAGAAYLGFNFFRPSPRCLALRDAAFMATSVPEGICKVGLVVDADNVALDQAMSHGPGRRLVPFSCQQLPGAAQGLERDEMFFPRGAVGQIQNGGAIHFVGAQRHGLGTAWKSLLVFGQCRSDRKRGIKRR